MSASLCLAPEPCRLRPTSGLLVGRSLSLPPEPVNIARGEIVDKETLVAGEPRLARNEGWIPDVDARLPLMLPVVVYKGAAPWKAAREVNELVEPAEGTLASYRPSQRYRVLDERNAGEDDFPRRNLGSALVRLERIRSPSNLAAHDRQPPATVAALIPNGARHTGHRKWLRPVNLPDIDRFRPASCFIEVRRRCVVRATSEPRSTEKSATGSVASPRRLAQPDRTRRHRRPRSEDRELPRNGAWKKLSS